MGTAGYKKMSAAERVDLWRRYRLGESIGGIARALGRSSASMDRWLARTGGIVPAPRSRAVRVLSLKEREEVSRGLAAGGTIRGIARTLCRAPSTVSNEVSRHGGRGHYRAAAADRAAWRSARRPKLCLLAKNRQLQQIVAVKLKQDWAPQQIAGWLKNEYPKNPGLWVSHETIYRSLFVQTRGVLKKELLGHLRSKRRKRRSLHAAVHGGFENGITDAVSIRDRPAEIEDRAVPGHWEGDLIEGSKGTFIATLVERKSRFVIMVKVPSKQTAHVVAALIKAVRKLPAALRRSLTWDRGVELSSHAKFTNATDVKVYFCDPSSPWQRGSNENTNGLLRQYYPKGTNLSVISQSQLNTVARKLNTRPRETLHWKTPAYMLGTSVSSIL
jgi:IS30 family transposase